MNYKDQDDVSVGKGDSAKPSNLSLIPEHTHGGWKELLLKVVFLLTCKCCNMCTHAHIQK